MPDWGFQAVAEYKSSSRAKTSLVHRPIPRFGCPHYDWVIYTILFGLFDCLLHRFASSHNFSLVLVQCQPAIAWGFLKQHGEIILRHGASSKGRGLVRGLILGRSSHNSNRIFPLTSFVSYD